MSERDEALRLYRQAEQNIYKHPHYGPGEDYMGMVCAEFLRLARAQPHSRQEGEISERPEYQTLPWVGDFLNRRYEVVQSMKREAKALATIDERGVRMADLLLAWTKHLEVPSEFASPPAGGASNADSGSPPPKPQARPRAWLHTWGPHGENSFATTKPPSSFDQDDLSENEVIIDPLYVYPHALSPYEPCLSVGRCRWNEQAVPERWVLVPRDPPQEMLDAWTRKSMLRASVRECYQSMLSAAPHPATKRECADWQPRSGHE